MAIIKQVTILKHSVQMLEILTVQSGREVILHRDNAKLEAMRYIQELLCSLRSTHAATLSIEYVMIFCLEKMNDRRRFKPELTVPPDGLSVIFSEDTPSKKTDVTE